MKNQVSIYDFQDLKFKDKIKLLFSKKEYCIAIGPIDESSNSEDDDIVKELPLDMFEMDDHDEIDTIKDKDFNDVHSVLDDTIEFDACEKENTKKDFDVNNESGLPIITISKEKMNPMEQVRFHRDHQTKQVYEHLVMSLETINISPNCKIPFRHRNTECELICSDKTVIISETADVHVIFERPDKYYRIESESLLYPCECLSIVDDKTYSLFKNIESNQEKAHLIYVYSRLTKHQKEFVISMASRPARNIDGVQGSDEKEYYTPIRDQEALEMMYKVCKHTYKPSVRAHIESLKAQLATVHGTDKVDLVNQLAYAIGIDTHPRVHSIKTYDEIIAIMNKHIYGMNDLKEAIAEYIIAMQQSGSSYCAMLLVGPPGVGKTSVCDAMAECFEVPLVHIDCSGVDMITMSGLIKSYGGAKTGKIMDGFFEEGRTDVLMRLDELDKMAKGKDGDPYGAFIKPFGPQRKYYDEYLADDTDVSSTKFIATANDISKIPGYILSRFEDNIFYIDAYTLEEKVEIAQNYIIPRKLNEHNIDASELSFTEEALVFIAKEYCTDQGVREISGYITTLLRKAITEWSRGVAPKPLTVDVEYVEVHLKRDKRRNTKRQIGFVS